MTLNEVLGITMTPGELSFYHMEFPYLLKLLVSPTKLSFQSLAKLQ
jgi:hypothetical protein